MGEGLSPKVYLIPRGQKTKYIDLALPTELSIEDKTEAQPHP